MKHQLRWFTHRVGKRIYRKNNQCALKGCKGCIDVGENGLVVADKEHAQYLHAIQYDLDINYFDKPIKNDE